jgi:hypothetical protein
MPHKRALKRFDQLLELLDGETGQVQDLLYLVRLRSVACASLLSFWSGQFTINLDKLY